MNSNNGISMNNAAVAALPKHLLQFAVDQRYEDYTPVDHAVWRFIMRQNMFFLKEYAHKFTSRAARYRHLFRAHPAHRRDERDPRRIGWGAVAVDGFIPPGGVHGIPGVQVLVIACDMRQINHIEYTPAPDIVHERRARADHRRPRVRRLPAAFRRSRREGDVIEERLRALRSDPSSLDLKSSRTPDPEPARARD
jgi:hypothetical protein